MTTGKDPAEDFADVSTERAITFWMTLLVATLIVSMSAYVLSFALLDRGAPLHRAAIATQHARS